MNDLACGVKSCAYNDCNCCKRDGIKVEGTMAESSSATCCASFCECGSPRVTSACECEPKRVTNIICDAVKCRYNDDKNCNLIIFSYKTPYMVSCYMTIYTLCIVL